jgi:hypothetical protein
MSLKIEHIEVLEAPEATQMKKQADGDDLAFRHSWRTFGRLTKDKRLGGLVKIFTKFINKTENIANFIEVNHIEMCLNI